MEKMKEIELKIPNLGEAASTEIIEVTLKKGQKIEKHDPLLVLESEKAAMEVPSDFVGEVIEIFVQEGDQVNEGLVFAKIKAVEDEENVKRKGKITSKENEQDQISDIKVDAITNQEKTQSHKNFSNVVAGPAVRKYARELELDLSKIKGTGLNNRITKDDLKKYIHSKSNTNVQKFGDFDSLKEYGEYKLQNQSKIDILSSKNLFNSWNSIPHVFHFEKVDISKIEQQRKQLNEISSVKVSLLSFLVKAINISLNQFPLLNSSLIDDGKIMIKKYVNIGVAVNTSDGLLVPVIKNVDKMNVGQIASEINILAEKAREKKLLKEDLSAATFTVSSLGQVGGTSFTPIINPPQVGIIGISRSIKEPMISDGNLAEKVMLPISLSYDHRIINGVYAGNFMNLVKKTLEDGLSKK
tara:strand:- start:3364 stop:4599 length:1236 start_codon:yes stop_codon:yes gene_type:complete